MQFYDVFTHFGRHFGRIEILQNFRVQRRDFGLLEFLRGGSPNVGGIRLKNHQRRQRHDNPGPRTQRIMRKIEKQIGGNGVFFVFGGQHFLTHITAAARLRARIPHRPPLNRNRDYQHRHKDRRICQVGNEIQLVLNFGIAHQTRQTANFRLLQRHHSRNNRARHRHNILEKVSPNNAPETA